MRLSRAFIRVAFGVIVLLHALAHAVLPMRGLLEFPPSSVGALITIAAYLVALVGLFAAGLGVLGVHPLRNAVPRLMAFGIVASVVGLVTSWDVTLWRGVAVDAALVVAFVAVLQTRLLEVNVPPVRRHSRRILRVMMEAVAFAFFAYVAVAAVMWPWYRRWGATVQEQARTFPSDRWNRNMRYELTHAVTIEAPPEIVWAWLVQLGQDRAGFYSYDWLERLFGADVHNVDEIRPEWQRREVGDLVRATQPDYLGGAFGRELGWRVSQLEPSRLLVLEQWGAFVLEPTGAGQTRFIIRSTIGGPEAPAWGAGLTLALFELPHFIMERKMMLTIKARAERDARISVEASR